MLCGVTLVRPISLATLLLVAFFLLSVFMLTRRIEASKEVIIMNRDCKVTDPFLNAKNHIKKGVIGDLLKDVHFILPVVCDRTQKLACNVIQETLFIFVVRESYI